MTAQYPPGDLAAQIKRDVATWPPLSPETRAELAVLLAGDGDA